MVEHPALREGPVVLYSLKFDSVAQQVEHPALREGPAVLFSLII